MGTGGCVNFLMLNPSIADDHLDDPTIRKCVGFAKRWGYGSIHVTNLFAFLATDPNDLKEMARRDYRRAVGDGNDDIIMLGYSLSKITVCAWGNLGRMYGRDKDVLHRVLLDCPVYCIGVTHDGNPLHPGRTAYTNAPVRFTLPERD
jgi:hypothetical protein